MKKSHLLFLFLILSLGLSQLNAQCTNYIPDSCPIGPCPIPEYDQYNCETGLCGSPIPIPAPWQPGNTWLLQEPFVQPGITYTINFGIDPAVFPFAGDLEITVFSESLTFPIIISHNIGLISNFTLPDNQNYILTITPIGGCGLPAGIGPFTGFDIDALCPLPCLNEGDLIITEVMHTPNAVPEEFGEYFEVYNASFLPIDLNGMIFQDLGTDNFTVNTSLIINPGEYAVFGPEIDPIFNGGIPVTYQYDYANFQLDPDDEINIAFGATLVDLVVFDPVSFPSPLGASISIDPESIDFIANDWGYNWCEGTSVFGSGDFGTPGFENDTCLASSTTLSHGPSVKKCDCCDEEGGSGSQGGSFNGQ